MYETSQEIILFEGHLREEARSEAKAEKIAHTMFGANGEDKEGEKREKREQKQIEHNRLKHRAFG